MTTGSRDGLLEQASLLVRPRASRAAFPGQQTLEDDSGRPVGLVFWQTSARQGTPRWLAWLARPRLAVHETGDDLPLVCTAHRFWGLVPLWEVRDADAHVVGQLYGPLVQDRFGRPQARRARAPGGAAGAAVYRDEAGLTLLSTAAGPAGLTLTFGLPAWDDPFLKMLLLTAALVSGSG